MSQEMFGKAVWVVGKETIHMVDQYGFPQELVDYLAGDDNTVLSLIGDTHLAKFVRGDGPSEGWLENTMPGSKFTYFSFSMAVLEGIKVVVGTYTSPERNE